MCPSLRNRVGSPCNAALRHLTCARSRSPGGRSHPASHVLGSAPPSATNQAPPAPRRVYVTGVTKNPDSACVTQQARNLSFELEERQPPLRFLVRDRDSKFTRSFDEVFRTENAEVILTPIRSPRANAFAERWVEVRSECMD